MGKFEIPLCKTFNNESTSLPKGKWMVEPKYDGLRCLIFIDTYGNITFKSRTNKKIYNIELIKLQLDSLRLKGVVLDGELQAKDWNQTISILHTQTLHPEREQVSLYIFDIIDKIDWDNKTNDTSLKDRKERLKKIFGKNSIYQLKNVRILEGFELQNFEQANKIYKQLLATGFEGVVLKEADSTYPFKRSEAWLKWKPSYTYDLKIEGVIEGLGKHKGRLGAFICRHKGKKVKVGTGLTDIQREEYWTKNMVGKIIEVKCQEITRDGRLRFPSFVRLREDK